MEAKIVCICCPIGCEISIIEKDGTYNISGNKCIRGENYAKEELKEPKRVVTATCAINSTKYSRLPVKTKSPVPKDMIFELLDQIYKTKVNVPVKTNDIIIKNFKNLNIDIIATLTIEE